MQKWEYKFLTVAHPNSYTGIGVVKFVDGEEIENWGNRDWKATQALDELGQDGWELVDTIWRVDPITSMDSVYILKRPKE